MSGVSARNRWLVAVVALVAVLLLALGGVMTLAQAARVAAVVVVAAAFATVLARLPSTREPDERFVAMAAPVPVPADRPLRLEQIERAVSVTTAADVHYRLRPVLRTVASARLRDRHGVDLDHDAERARVLLGDALYEAVRADAPEPVDRNAASPDAASDVAGFVDRLEAL
jgi:hypothetical protein